MKAMVNQLLDRYLAVVELEESTRKTYVGYPDVHVCPTLGVLPPEQAQRRGIRHVLRRAAPLPRALRPAACGSRPPDEGRAPVQGRRAPAASEIALR
jgi:hypothetical protein